MGNLIEIPFENERSSGKTMHLWTVVRVLQHMTEDTTKNKKQADARSEKELNLSSEDSLSAASLDDQDAAAYGDENDEYDEADMATRATMEMPYFKV